MKFLIVTCLHGEQDEVLKIFKHANISVFSATGVIGFNENQSHNYLQEWFASGGERADSMMLFSFTADEKADLGMELVKEYNSRTATNFPIRAIIVPVESASF